MTAKYNWQEIKQKYLEAPEIEVENFLRTFLELDPKKPLSGDKKTKTAGWRDEKQELLKKQTDLAKKELEKDPKIKLANENILKAINNYEVTVATLIGKGQLTLEEAVKAKQLWEVLRVSQNLPTTFVKNENNNKNEFIENEDLKAIKTKLGIKYENRENK